MLHSTRLSGVHAAEVRRIIHALVLNALSQLLVILLGELVSCTTLELLNGNAFDVACVAQV